MKINNQETEMCISGLRNMLILLPTFLIVVIILGSAAALGWLFATIILYEMIKYYK